MRKKKGFSLPEILVVVAIIGVLLPLLIWLYNSNWLIFHRTSKQQGLQEEIRDCLNKMMLDVKSTYYFEKIDSNSGIILHRFNGDTLNGSGIDTSAPQDIDYPLEKTVKVEYRIEQDKSLSRYNQITRIVNGDVRDEYRNISKEQGFKVIGLTPDFGTHKFKATDDVKKTAGISVYIYGQYEDDSMKGKEQRLEIETMMFSPYLRNYLIYGYDDGPLSDEGGYFTNIEVMGKSGAGGNDEF